MSKILTPYVHTSTKPREEDPKNRKIIQSIDFTENLDSKSPWTLLGYPDDTGVISNLGRPGAALGPNEIRKQLYKKSSFALNTNTIPKIKDLGNLMPSNELTQTHENAHNLIKKLRSSTDKIISLGGGHDFALCDYKDLFQSKEDWLLINVDAHLDMRPNPKDPKNQEHSGTPFRLLIEQAKYQQPLYVLAYQYHCNCEDHVQWAIKQGIKLRPLKDFSLDQQNNFEMIRQDLTQLDFMNKKIALSIDLDAFSSAFAPGVSAPQTRGLNIELFFEVLKLLKDKVHHLGLYELNPNLDIDHRTANLAADIIYQTVYS